MLRTLPPEIEALCTELEPPLSLPRSAPFCLIRGSSRLSSCSWELPGSIQRCVFECGCVNSQSPNHLDQETLAMEARKIAATSSSLASHDAAPASAAPPPKPINPYTTRGTSRKSAPALAYDSDTDSSPRDSRQITHPYATAPTPAPAQVCSTEAGCHGCASGRPGARLIVDR